MTATPLTLTAPDPGWIDRAICRGMGAVMGGETPEDEKRAKATCHVCPVKQDCGSYALSLPPSKDVYGVAGGMAAKERELVRRRIRRGKVTTPEEPRACTRGKQCAHGEVEQPATEFYQRPRTPGGRETQCRTCCQKRCRERKAAKKAAEAAMAS